MGRIILVPDDFSSVADMAILHGISLAEKLDMTVCLVHVFDPKNSDTDLWEDPAYQKVLATLASRTEQFGENTQVTIEPVLRVGNLFKTVNAVVWEIRPHLMVMGTHGKQGLQHLFGSHALRVVLDAECPVLVVQERTFRAGYTKMVIPVDCESEPGHITEWALKMARLFGTEILLFQSGEHSADRITLLHGNFSRIAAALNENNVPFSSDNARTTGDFSGQVIAFAGKNDASLIMTMTLPAADSSGYIFSDWNERLMFNPHQIPVMFIDRTDTNPG